MLTCCVKSWVPVQLLATHNHPVGHTVGSVARSAHTLALLTATPRPRAGSADASCLTSSQRQQLLGRCLPCGVERAPQQPWHMEAGSVHNYQQQLLRRGLS